MSLTLYVCATCTAEFTRRSSANRHNAHAHKGRGKTVRSLDYVVGALAGRYRQPDPSLHPRGGRDRTHTTSSALENGVKENYDAGEIDSSACWDKGQEAVDKVIEIKKCICKILSPREAQAMVKECLDMYAMTQNMAVLDCALAIVRRVGKFQDSLSELRFSGSKNIPQPIAGNSDLFSADLFSANNFTGHTSNYIRNGNLEEIIKDAIEGLKSDIEEGATIRQAQPSSFTPRPSDGANDMPSLMELMGIPESYLSDIRGSHHNRKCHK
jgi:hypothetical protein